MSTFRTELIIDENPDKIGYQSKILSIGSDFSNTIADHLHRYRFNINSNPFGTIYNPISIFNLIEASLNHSPIDDKLVTEHEGIWNHFDFHLRTGERSKKSLLDALNQRMLETHDYIKEAGYLMITLGSAYVYKRNDSKHIVANCHKASPNSFTKSLLTVKEIVEGFRKIYHSLNHVGNIILVVSPIMHTKDSITLNAVSKSVLRLACHEIKNEFPYVKYFPAYEFLLNDLRDYRYYEKDLLHPNELAMDYIFNKFTEAYVEEAYRERIADVEEILQVMESTPYNPQSEAYQLQVKTAIDKVDELGGDMNLSLLKERLEEKLA